MDKKYVPALIASLALILFIAVAAVLYGVEENKVASNVPLAKKAEEKTAPQENKAVGIIETADTSKWRFFADSAHQYQIKYPADLRFWIPKEKKFLGGDILQKLEFRKDASNFIDLTVLPKNYDVYADDLEKNLPYKEIEVNGQKALRLDGKTGEIYSSETTIFGPKFTYQISFTEFNARTLTPVYEQIISTFAISEDFQPGRLNYWELTAGNPADTCSGPTYAGEATVHGWFDWNYVYVEKSWVLNISKEDAEKLPIKEILGGTVYYDEFMKSPALVLSDAPQKLQEELKQASPENPIELKIRGFRMYCEGAPTVSLNPMK